MPDVRITCSTRIGEGPTAHHTITALGGRGWVWPVSEVVRTLTAGTNTFFTIVQGRRAEVLVVRDAHGAHLRAHHGGIPSDDLLQLEECPPQ